MKKYIYFIFIILILASCGSKNTETESSNEVQVIDESFQYVDTVAPYAPVSTSPSANLDVPESANSQSTDDSQDYQNGYNSGMNMGYIAGQNNSEYNPYLPVGPYARTHSLDYRSGYAAGYAVGYEDGQQATHQGIYSDDDGYEYVEEYEYYEEDY